MKPLHHTLRWPVVATLVLATALAACSRKADDELTAGQRLDGAISEAKEAARDTKADASAAMADASASASQAADAAGRAATDMSITTKINAALAMDDKLKATQINVDTREGMVTLSGNAPDATSRDRATTLATAVDGVKNVNNQLVVSGS
jgi:hyperosmotically inducible protein